MTIVTRMPRGEMLPETRLENRINRLFQDAFGPSDWQNGDGPTTWVPPVDVLEEPTAIRITAEVPGIAPKDLKISLEHNLLTVSGTKQQVAEERTEKVHRYERSYGTFARTFTLPTSVDAGAITASYDQGVLTVTLPKAEAARPRQIDVTVTPTAK
jgi:HSP20 family protein